ncbi:IS66-like element accessory protein TnpA [Rhodopila sp.]|uniref:IS66-like element accessory protein TnpA n=1 Tax=Rhodopila sp. TaxID=2480087 RepID=UPI003D135AFF
METNANPAAMPAAPKSAHTSSHKSARTPPVELITRGERRRRWTVEQKQTIAAQSLAPGASPTEVARQHGIGTGQLYSWRQALLAAQPSVAAPMLGRFARVEVAAGRTMPHVEGSMIPAPTPPPTSAQPAGLIEIVLPNGTTLRVDAQVDPRALRRVLSALRG